VNGEALAKPKPRDEQRSGVAGKTSLFLARSAFSRFSFGGGHASSVTPFLRDRSKAAVDQ
jgi:hypothetical protein